MRTVLFSVAGVPDERVQEVAERVLRDLGLSGLTLVSCQEGEIGADFARRLERVRLKGSPFLKRLRQAIDEAARYPDSALNTCRKILEHLLHDVFEVETGTPAGTRDLDALIRDLGKERLIPRRIQHLCEVVRGLGNFGSHHASDGEEATDREARIALDALLGLLDWHQKRGSQ